MLIATPEARAFPRGRRLRQVGPARLGAGAHRASVARRDRRARWRRSRSAPRSSSATGCSNVRLVATEACRRARNGNHFLALAARRDRAPARGDPARGGGAARGDLLRAAGLAARPRRCWSSTSAAARPSSSGSTSRRSRRSGGRRRSSNLADGRRRRRPGGGADRRLHLGAARGGDAARALCRRRRRQRPLRADVLVLRGADRRVQALYRDAWPATTRRLPDDRHLGHGDDGRARRISGCGATTGARSTACGCRRGRSTR